MRALELARTNSKTIICGLNDLIKKIDNKETMNYQNKYFLNNQKILSSKHFMNSSSERKRDYVMNGFFL